MADGFREVSLSRNGKLVVMRRGAEWFLRLRLWVAGEWRFSTPALGLQREHVEWLDQAETEKFGYPIDLVHPEMDGRLNLIVYRGKLRVHLDGIQYVGEASGLREAFEGLAGE